MLTAPTVEKMKTLHLVAMADEWLRQQQTPAVQSLSFDDRLGLLVDVEVQARDNKRLTRLLTDARLRLKNACIEDVDYPPKRNLDKHLTLKLASCQWIEQHRNVLITGATGTGKSYLACAFAQASCRRGFRTLYVRLPRLLDDMNLAHADGSYPRLLQRLAKIDLLVVDDWGIKPLTDPQRHDLLEVFEDRYDLRSSVVTSQLPVDKWHDHIGDPSVADAILDRLVHNAYKIELKGPSRRKPEKELK